MGRHRKADKHLPRRMYLVSGTYWYVDMKNKWHKLDRDFARALARYATLQDSAPMHRIDLLIARYENEILPLSSPSHQKGRKQQFKRIREAFGHFPPEDLAQSDVWEYYTKAGMTQQARHEVSALSAVMGLAVRWGVLKQHPLLKMRLPGHKARERYVTDEEYIAFRPFLPRMHQLAMDLSLITAMRQKDILDLDRTNWTDKGLKFTASKTRKLGRRPIEFAMGDDLRATIEAALAIEPRVRRFIFCSTKGKNRGKRFTIDGFQTGWQKAQLAAMKDGAILERFTFHDIRAKSLSDAASLEEARVRAGHSDARTTDRIYRRLPETATAQKIAHLRAKS